MKILHVINNLASGGAEKLLTDVLPKMKEQGHEVAVAISNGELNVETYEVVLQSHEIEVINYKSSFYNPLLIFKMIKTLRKGKYDIVHAHLFPSQYWLAFASFFKPKHTRLVKTEHAIFNERHKYAILKPLEKLIYSRYAVTIGITPLVKENLEKWIGLKNVVVIANGVNLNKVFEGREQAFKEPMSMFHQDKFNILMTGRFDGVQKDQNSLILAASYLDKDVHLYFAGEGPFMELTIAYAASLDMENNTHFLGMRTDIYQLMASVDMNVLSTNHEGLSGVALESMASGKPFLGSRVGGVMDIVPDDSFLFPSKNPEALAKKIKELKENEAQRYLLVNKASKHIQQFDISNMVSNSLKLYTNTLKADIN